MPVYNARMENIYYDETPSESQLCEVRIGDNEIVVTYEDENNYTYKTLIIYKI